MRRNVINCKYHSLPVNQRRDGLCYVGRCRNSCHLVVYMSDCIHKPNEYVFVRRDFLNGVVFYCQFPVRMLIKNTVVDRENTTTMEKVAVGGCVFDGFCNTGSTVGGWNGFLKSWAE